MTTESVLVKQVMDGRQRTPGEIYSRVNASSRRQKLPPLLSWDQVCSGIRELVAAGEVAHVQQSYGGASAPEFRIRQLWDR